MKVAFHKEDVLINSKEILDIALTAGYYVSMNGVDFYRRNDDGKTLQAISLKNAKVPAPNLKTTELKCGMWKAYQISYPSLNDAVIKNGVRLK